MSAVATSALAAATTAFALAVAASSATAATTPVHGPTATTAQTPTLTAAPRPRLAATLRHCTTGPAVTDRAAVFTGSMPARRGAVTLGMRFTLYQRQGGLGAFKRLKVPGFSAWVRSDRGVSGFVYDKRVESLAAPSAYRVVVDFRWYDARGRTVHRAQRTSAACRQQELRADLGIASVAVGAVGADGRTTYTVVVSNDGRSAVGAPFTTTLTVNGSPLAEQTLSLLGAGRVATLRFSGPACVPGTPIVATADAGGTIDEADETDNVTRSVCPAA